MKKDMILYSIAKRLFRNGRTAVRTAAYSSTLTCVQRLFAYIIMNTMKKNMLQNIDNLVMNTLKSAFCGTWTRLRYALMFLLMMTVGVGKIWGDQVTGSGLYYIINDNKNAYAKNSNNNWYMVPASTGGENNIALNQWAWNDDANTPFVTTFQTRKDNNSIWVVKEYSGNYYLIHLLTGKYITYNTPHNTNRRAFHLETNANPGDDALFNLISYSGTPLPYSINPIGITEGNMYLNPSKNNQAKYYGTGSQESGLWVGGLIGLYNKPGGARSDNANDVDAGSRWFFEAAALFPKPTINWDDATYQFSFEYDNTILPSGYDILYTTNGDNPEVGGENVHTLTEYDGHPIFATGNYIVKAVIARYGVVLTEVASQEVSIPVGQCAMPLITYNNTTSELTMTSATADVTIHYTLSGDNPTNSDPVYSSLSKPQLTARDSGDPFTVKAIAVKDGLDDSNLATLIVEQVATPTIQNNGSNAISITCTTDDAAIYYTTDGTTPSSSNGSLYTEPLTENVSNKTIKAIAMKTGMVNSCVGTGTVELACNKPTFKSSGYNVSISCDFPSETKIYYTTNGNTPTTSSTEYSGVIDISKLGQDFPITIKAIAVATSYTNSNVAEFKTVSIDSQTAFESFVSSAIAGTASDIYFLETDVRASGLNIIPTFSGSLIGSTKDDGSFYSIDGLTHAMFNTLDGGTVNGIMFTGVNITEGNNVGNAGAVANEAKGSSHIYNCGVSGSITGSNYAGSLVGLLNGEARVINCFSEATVTGTKWAGGIVGYNNFGSTPDNIKTMVMNCVFYGNVNSNTKVSPIYGGTLISNNTNNTGLNNFNYYRFTSNFSTTLPKSMRAYNGAFAMEEQYLNHFEFYRLLLNSNRPLASWYVSGVRDDYSNKMAKWVLDPAKGYPILKKQGKYTSIINFDPAAAPPTNVEKYTIDELEITITGKTGSIKVPITGMDPDHFIYNDHKVQLPYYNDYFDDNYKDGKVVTGWMITGVSLSDENIVKAKDGGFTKTDTWLGYNFADRMNYSKDLYSESDRIFSQGAYFDVPYGVKGITIAPKWGTAYYIADPYFDRAGGYDNLTNVIGEQFPSSTMIINNQSQTVNTLIINGQSQRVYTSLSELPTFSGPTVYDNALVLVGNLHMSTPPTIAEPFTIMSADLDKDNEPDFSLIYNHSGRKAVSQIRFDFLNVPGTAMAQKPNGAGSTLRNVSVFNPSGWFEVTNTCLIRFAQFEYDNGSKATAPLILQGGIYDQFIYNNANTPSNTTKYILLGGNAWFNEFNNGCHNDKKLFTPHIPISVNGGYYKKFYLSGIYSPGATVNSDDAECYISSGKFAEELAGAGQQQIAGNVKWQIYNADIENFFGGGINAEKPITGNIEVNIFNSKVRNDYCGGPKFGDMSDNSTVVTNAEGCQFSRYFGAGYGGTSYNRLVMHNAKKSIDWDNWLSDYTDKKGKYYVQVDGNHNGDDYQNKISDGKGLDANGIATDFEYEYFTGTDGVVWARLYVNFASFSLASTYDVTSNLTDCKISGNFYGGGNLGEVRNKVKSVLADCEVEGNVFGGGFSASVDPVPVRNADFDQRPEADTDAGVFNQGSRSSTTTPYTWTTTTSSLANNGDAGTNDGTDPKQIFTTDPLNTLGQVENTTLTLKGSTKVKGSIGAFGGGDMSAVNGNSSVIIAENADIYKDVYGGGNTADVLGSDTVSVAGGTIKNIFGGGRGKNTTVQGNVIVNIGKKFDKNEDVEIQGVATITGNVYGGSAYGTVNATTTKTSNGTITNWADYAAKTTKINVFKGAISGNVFGGGLGDDGSEAIEAQVCGNVTVTVGSSTSGDAPTIGGSIYGGSNLNGKLWQDSSVKIINGTIGTKSEGNLVAGTGNVHGGGFGSSTLVQGTVEVSIGDETTGGTATIFGDVYGGSAKGIVNATWDDGNNAWERTANAKTDVYLYGCTSVRDIYGGGLGDNTSNPKIAADVYGPVRVFVEDGKAQNVFGCNNKYGTPKNTVAVTVNGTAAHVNEDNTTTPVTPAVFALGAVYGGGNLADYAPTESGAPAVTINNCASSVKDVFGGGNAAAVPATNVIVNGGIIDRVFAGGNGETAAANVAGNASAVIHGGTIRQVFGGSNTSGTIGGTPSVSIEKATGDGACEMHIKELYGGGNLAASKAGSITIGCTGGVGEGIGDVYGGANAADIGTSENPSNIELNITGGSINRVFGGNNASGTIYGTITVNVNWATGSGACGTNSLGSVFGGGNQAVYNAPAATTENTTADNYPVVNILNGTVSGDVFGGGLGKVGDATKGVVYGNPQVTINGASAVVNGGVYGGGSLAPTTGDPVVTLTNGSTTNIFGGGKAANVNGATTVNINGGAVSTGVYGGCDSEGTVNNTSVTLSGGTIGAADALAEVCGGGLGKDTEVSGTTHVNAGTGTPFTTTSYSGSATLFCDIYGGSAFGNVNNSEVNLFSLAGTSFDYDVYGGGKGEFVSADNTANKYAKVTTKATVNMYATTITGHIYGGCNVHGLAGETEVNMYGGTLGTSGSVGDLLFGGGHGKETTTTKATVKVGSTTTSDDDPPITTYNEGSTIYSNVYGGSALGTVNDANVELYNATTTNLTGDVFGGGMGQLADGDLPAVQAIIGDATVNLYEAAIKENIYGGCNIYGVVNGKAIVNLIGGSVAKDVYGGGKGNATSFGTDGSVEVNVGTAVNTGSTSVAGDIYGGSALGHVTAPIVNVYSGTVSGSVFGGGKGALAATNTSATVSGKATVNMYGANIKALYGGCNLCGDVNGDTEVNVIGGNVTKDVDTDGVFGGGYGQNTSVTGDVTVNIGKYDAEATTKISGSAVITGDVYGGSAEGKVNTADETNSTTTKNKKTTVHLYAGQITGNVYGGGLGRKPSSATATDGIEAHEYGDVLVDLNNNDGVCYVDGSIFGCNNANGSPSGTSEVHIYKTVHLTSGGDVTNEEPTTYELDAVYGGGDQAAYNGNSTKVVIENCDPSIEYVYGGGNAADVTNTYVEINGAKEIRTVFGGGNGSGTNNPGANVSGATQVYLKGGTIHEAFGGSNSKGIVANGTNVYVSDEIAGCPLNVDHVYGAGRNAGMRGKANIVLGCQPTTVIEDIYGGAESADIEGDIELTITSGHFKKVFGGNKSGGAIKGSVRLNIEETNNCSAPLIIDQLFGCGNEAPYSVYGYYQEGSVWKPRNEAQFNQMTADEKAAEHVPYDDPEVHIISFTEIGQVFGGGLGAPAMVYGNPKVFINQRPNYKTENATGESADKHVLGTIGAFSYPEGTSTVNVAGGVYGGGSEANVYGSTTVFIGSAAQVEMHSLPKVSGAYPMKYVEGANINCNVYGGGLKADVSGSTEVVIGADKVLSGATYTYPATTFAGTSETEVAKYKGIVITGDVFGAGQGETANVESAMVGGNGTVVMAGGSVKKSVYGGGQLSQVVGDTHVTVNGGTIGTAKADLPAGVTMGAVYGNVYGGGKGNTDNAQAGLIKGDTYITISDGTILHNIYGGGAYGSVGDFTFTTGAPSARTGGGTTNVTITGGTIGTDGHENGMIFGSSRGDVAKPVGTPAVDPNDKLAWVYDANVIIGTSGVTTGPQINGSVYGSGENGHTYRNTDIKIYSGTIGINSSDNVTIYDLLDNTKKVY